MVSMARSDTRRLGDLHFRTQPAGSFAVDFSCFCFSLSGARMFVLSAFQSLGLSDNPQDSTLFALAWFLPDRVLLLACVRTRTKVPEDSWDRSPVVISYGRFRLDCRQIATSSSPCFHGSSADICHMDPEDFDTTTSEDFFCQSNIKLLKLRPRWEQQNCSRPLSWPESLTARHSWHAMDSHCFLWLPGLLLLWTPLSGLDLFSVFPWTLRTCQVADLHHSVWFVTSPF